MPNPSLSDYLKSKLKSIPKEQSYRSVWKGPSKDGITQSLINEYLTCKERFRLHVIEGLDSEDGYNHRIEYGNMWHILEECKAAPAHEGRNGKEELISYVRKLRSVYPESVEQILKTYNMAIVQFPIYCDYWRKNDHEKKRQPVLQEHKFGVNYELPSGRTVKLRGKFDSVDFIPKKGFYLQENKSKSEIDEPKLQKQLTFDLQTMTYLVALYECKEELLGEDKHGLPIIGVRYNVIKRPLSGGAGTIRPHKATAKKPAETNKEFFERLSSIIKERANEFFARWEVEVPAAFVLQFKRQFLNPILENILDDYEWWNYCKEYAENPFDYLTRQSVYPDHRSRHYRLPYGIYNVIAEGGNTNLDEYLLNGSKAGLRIIDNLFPELTDL